MTDRDSSTLGSPYEADQPPAASAEPDDRGLYAKFRVERLDGRSAAGYTHHGCEYFVLDRTHDKHAAAALLAYAESCTEERPALARNLMADPRVGLLAAPGHVPGDCGHDLAAFQEQSAEVERLTVLLDQAYEVAGRRAESLDQLHAILAEVGALRETLTGHYDDGPAYGTVIPPSLLRAIREEVERG